MSDLFSSLVSSSTPEKKRRSFLPSGSSLLKAGACAATLVAAQTQAFEFKVGELDAFVDTIFSASAAMRTESAKNHGTADPSGEWSIFNDAGDVYSSPLSLLTDAGIGNGDFGVFTRFSYLYDYTIMNKDCSNCERSSLWPLAPAGFNQTRPGDQPQRLVDGIADDAQNLAGNKFTLYDLFVYGNFRIFDHPLNVRVGKQVVSWGESNIMGGGISQMQNPTDLGKATTPGTEVKETLMPQETAFFNLGITDQVSVEAYYTWKWRNSVFVPVGTLFSPFDFLGEGYNPDLFVRGIEFAGRDEPDGGQWGVNMHFILESLNFADLGVYYVRSHAYTGYIGLDEDYAPRLDPQRASGTYTLAGYEWKYGEDQNTYGISLNGEALLGASFAMELNLKQNFFDTRECRNLYGISAVRVPDIGGLQVGQAFGPSLDFDPTTVYANTIDGCDINASDVYTYLLNITWSGGTNLLGADTLNLVFDSSAVWITELEHGDKTDRLDLRPNAFGTVVDPGIFEGVDGLDRPITDFSWGYAAVAGLVYNNVFANVNVAPTLIFVHNVEGYTPVNAGSLVENQRTVIAKLGFTRLSSSVDLQYVTWLGTAGVNDDRDNLSIVFKTNF
ncbi:MAG: DUF1302 family protein [Cycloclasticus sp.]|nr:DUF1302 family protein [Cycloclasticus sp.]